jgi:hypothetical protein
MAGAQIATSVTILNSLKGFQSISLKEYNTSAAAAIASGSVVEIAGAYFTFAGDENINASSWTAIATGSTAYIALTPSGTAGSQIVTASYLGTAPAWRDDLQGWYESAASNIRVIGTVYKNTSTSYTPKYLYNTMQDQKQQSISVFNASVASSLSVGGLYYGNAITVTNFIYGNTITSGSAFAVLSPYIPTTGLSILVTGVMMRGATNMQFPSQATRESSTVIRFSGGFINVGVNAGIADTTSFESGAPTTFSSIAMSW